jgi:hypothetical protein
MKWFVPLLCVALLGTVCLSPGDAAPGSQNRGPARKTGRKHVKHQGDKVLPRSKLKKLRDGTHPIHTTVGKHRTFATVKKGKLAGLFLKAPNGKVLRAKRLRVGRSRAAADAPGADLFTVAYCGAEYGGGQVCFRFEITVRITVSYYFPECCCGSGSDYPPEGDGCEPGCGRECPPAYPPSCPSDGDRYGRYGRFGLSGYYEL